MKKFKIWKKKRKFVWWKLLNLSKNKPWYPWYLRKVNLNIINHNIHIILSYCPAWMRSTFISNLFSPFPVCPCSELYDDGQEVQQNLRGWLQCHLSWSVFCTRHTQRQKRALVYYTMRGEHERGGGLILQHPGLMNEWTSEKGNVLGLNEMCLRVSVGGGRWEG